MAFDIVGFDSNYKVPRFAARVDFAQGPQASAGRLKVLLSGMKTSAGLLVNNGPPQQILNDADARAKCGVGSQLYRMARAALFVPGVEIWAQAVTEPAGTAATVTLAIGGTWTTNGQWGVAIAGTYFTGAISSSQTATQVAEAIRDAINARVELPFTATATSGTVTMTCRNIGVQGRDWLVWLDRSLLPAGLTATLTGSAAEGVDRVRAGAASSGTGTEDVTTALTQILSTRYARIAAASNDATNAALWESHVNAQALWNVQQYEHVIFGVNGTYANAQSLARTTLNAVRAQALWHRNSESHPCEIAAYKAAVRAATEGDNPIPDYDGLVLTPIAPQRFDTDVPTDAELATALDNGVTPITTENGEARVVRSITTYCVDGTQPDYRCLDIGDAVMPDHAAIGLSLLYHTEFRPANPRVGPEPEPEAPAPPSGVAFPSLWVSSVQSLLNTYFQNGWIEDPAAYPPQAVYNTVAKRIQSSVDIVPRRVQHQLSVIVRQRAA